MMLAVLGSRKVRMQTRSAVREAFASVNIARIFWTVIVVAAAFVVTSGFNRWLYSPNVFPINDVTVSGTFRYVDEREFAAVLSSLRGQNLFACDLEVVKDTVKAQPWIDSVAVRRQWPGTVAVEIKEQQPFARWASGGLVNVRGELFAPAPQSFPGGLPVFRGPDSTSAREVLARYRDLTAALAPAGLSVETLALDSRGSWQALATNGLKIMIGRRMDERRISRFVRAYPKVIGPELENIEQVDLRYPNGFALRWRPETKAM